MKKVFNYRLLIHLMFILICLSFVIPIMYVISVSLSSEQAIREFGYQLFPKELTLDAYRHVFKNPTQLVDSYKVTIFTSLIGSGASVIIMAMVAYALSRDDFYFKSYFLFYIDFKSFHLFHNAFWRWSDTQLYFKYPVFAYWKYYLDISASRIGKCMAHYYNKNILSAASEISG